MQYDGRSRGAHGGPRSAAGSSTCRTWVRSKPRAPARSRCCSGCSPTTSPRSPSEGPSTACCAARTGACSTTSSPIALEADRYLTVTNAANHVRDLAWFSARTLEGLATSRSPTGSTTTRCSPSRARVAREIVQAISDAPLPAADDRRRRGGWRARRCSYAEPATRARTASSCCARPPTPPRLWDELVRRGATPAGLGGAGHAASGGLLSPLRQRPLDSSAARSKRGWAGAARRTPASSAPRRVRGRARAAGRPRSSSPSRSRVPGSRARATRSAAGARSPAARSRPACGVGIGMAYVPAERPPRHAPADRRSWQDPRRPSSRRSRSTERAREWPRRTTPLTCCITPSTTGRASKADAGDARHHLVRPGRARRGRVLRPARGRDDARQGRPLRGGRVGEGRLRGARAAVGRDRRGQRGARRRTRR